MKRSVVVLLLVWPVLAHAAGRRSFVVVVTPAHDWRAEALAATLPEDLADDRLAPVATGTAELVVQARIDGPALVYELRAQWPGAPPPVNGSIALTGTDRIAIAGRLRDQLHRLARTVVDEGAADAARIELPAAGTIGLATALVLLVLASPLVFGRKAWRAARRSLGGVTVLGVAAVGMSVAAPANPAGVVFAAGGLAWATAIAVTVPIGLPPLVGLGRIEYAELWSVLGRWSVLVAQRLIALAVLYVPVGLVAWWLSDGLDDVVRIALVVPLAVLVVRQAIRIAVAVLAERLDRKLADPGADAAAWHAAVTGYLLGYLTRNGLPADELRLRLAASGHDEKHRIAIIASTGDEPVVYGGGATHTRIAIPRPMLELALAPWGRPHDYAAPRVSTLHWAMWNTGLVVASEQGDPITTADQRQPRDESDPDLGEREVLGEPVTLAGIIEPTALDERTTYRPHDDPLWLDWDPGDEYDGTDAGDRDFLFGFLMHAIATVHRHGDRLLTFALAVRRAHWLRDPVADEHTALLGARDHLVQYLGWQLWHREDRLTARAYTPELEAMSRTVLGEAVAGGRSPLRDRLVRMAPLVRGATAPAVRWRRFALAAVLLAGAGGVALAVVDAVRYHPTYVEHLSKETDHGKVP